MPLAAGKCAGAIEMHDARSTENAPGIHSSIYFPNVAGTTRDVGHQTAARRYSGFLAPSFAPSTAPLVTSSVFFAAFLVPFLVESYVFSVPFFVES